MESVVEQYNRDLAEWEYQVSRKPTTATKEQHRPLEMQSVLKHLCEIQERNKQKPPQKQRKKPIDRDSRQALKNRRYGVIHSGGIHNNYRSKRMNYFLYVYFVTKERIS